ncbi:MAG: hypothetical protein GF364_13105 [Candidatus Lokiarchaeota archaeon]|nr:hypothetical protein [Candidatus Lokiarchaeota archaeon]
MVEKKNVIESIQKELANYEKIIKRGRFNADALTALSKSIMQATDLPNYSKLFSNFSLGGKK